MFDTVVIGCGFAGAVVARELAEKGKKVLILEKKDHVGGNCYDVIDSYGVLIHKYGPHIFHTNNKRVYEYLSKYTKWYNYSHEVVANVNGQMLPIPFNLNTLKIVYGEEKSERLRKKLLQTYKVGSRVPILELKNSEEEEIREIANYVYENVFLKYTMKQWGQKPEEIDPSVTGRVPVLISEDNRYFQDSYQGMPREGYTALFNNMLNHDNIKVVLSCNMEEVFSIEENRIKINYENGKDIGKVTNYIYTGATDELFDCCYGRLPYRTLNFYFEHKEVEFAQSHAVVNYTVSEDYTRITEFKRLTGQNVKGTTIMREYPANYTGKDGEIPYYAIINGENLQLYEKYKKRAEKIDGLTLLGRLAEYKYYNIDAIVLKALELADTIF